MKNILIVDDEPHVIRVLNLALSRAGLLVDVAYDGVNALEYLQSHQPDAVITDIDMPRMDGKTLCTRICELFPDREFPIFIMTARAELEHRDWARNIPNMTFMEKPLSIRKLIKALDEHFVVDSEH
jgi:DNA-binding response OmpR family regulator